MLNLLKFPFVVGHAPVHHCKLIGQHEDYRALRRRTEQRLAALKASNRLYEDKNEPATARSCASASALANCAEFQSSIYQYQRDAALSQLLGLGGPDNWPW